MRVPLLNVSGDDSVRRDLSMSSFNLSSHRRRSHSASSPTPHKQLNDVTWRPSAKRSRPSSIRSPSYRVFAHDEPAEKWDVDQWRRGKRARRESNNEDSSDDASSHGRSLGMHRSDPISPIEQPLGYDAGFPSSSRLPCTSAAFQFFSQKQPRPNPQRGLSSARARLSRETSPREGDRISPGEVRRLQRDALSDLHRSVAESGEGLVRRMRDWERARSSPRAARFERQFAGLPNAGQPEAHGPSRRPTSYYGTPQAAAVVAEQSDEDEEDDDILIVGETASIPSARSPAHKKRALSLSAMEVDMEHSSPFASLAGSERSSSPIDRSSGPSAYSSDDEGHADMDIASGPFSTPALSHTYSISSNSSMVSLPFSLQAEESSPAFRAPSSSDAVVPGGNISPSSPTPNHLASTASRSEKALAALTLAMSNGAAGIADYEALRATDMTTLDAAHAGELWN